MAKILNRSEVCKRVDPGMRDLAIACLAAGWRAEQGGHHVKMFPTDVTKRPVVFSGSSSDHCARRNLRAQISRAGLVPATTN